MEIETMSSQEAIKEFTALNERMGAMTWEEINSSEGSKLYERLKALTFALYELFTLVEVEPPAIIKDYYKIFSNTVSPAENN